MSAIRSGDTTAARELCAVQKYQEHVQLVICKYRLASHSLRVRPVPVRPCVAHQMTFSCPRALSPLVGKPGRIRLGFPSPCERSTLRADGAVRCSQEDGFNADVNEALIDTLLSLKLATVADEPLLAGTRTRNPPHRSGSRP